MTPLQKQNQQDLERAREFVVNNETAHIEFKDLERDLIAEICNDYLLEMESQGIIQFTAKRETE